MQDVVVDWSFLFAHRKRILTGFLIGGLIAVAVYFAIPPRWEASALIQIGQIGTSASPGNLPLIESPEAVVAKIVRPSFIKGALQRAGHPELLKTLMPKQYDGKGRLAARAMNSSIVVVTLLAPTPDLAKHLTESVAAELIDEQNQLIEPRLKSTQDVISKLHDELDQKEKDSVIVDRQTEALQASAQNGKIDNTSLLLFLIKSGMVKEDRRQMALLINSGLTEPDTRPTRMIGEVEVLSDPAFPQPAQFIAIGIALGCAIAAALVWKSSRKNRR